MKRDFSLTPTTRGGRPRKPIEVAMTPMIDVIFLLLVFFVATSSFQMVEKLLPSGVSETKAEDSKQAAGNVEQPQEEPSQDALEQVIVELNRVGNLTVAVLNEVPLPDLESLKPRLQAISEAKADVPVVIDPEGDIEAADVIQAYDWAREAGLARVYLAVTK